MGVSCGNTSRLIFMLTLVVIYFLVELIVGISIHSISLVADSFHMLSDCLALVIGIVASQIAKWPRSSRNTFGWQRAEVMGSLINTVVLITLCMTILLRAIERFVETQAIESAQMMVYVGCGGLLVNILGLIVLGGHSHDGSHSETDPAISAPLTPTAFGTTLPLNNTDDAFLEVTSTHPISGVNNIYDRMDENVMQHFTDKDQRDNFEASQLDTKQQKVTVKVKHNHPKKSHKSSMNMQAVFLHVLADFMGSVIVVISALVLWLVPGEVSKGEAMWKLYIDPAMSMLMVTIILITAIPLKGSTTNTDYLTCVLDCGPNKNCQSDTCCPASNIPPPNATAVQFCPSNVHSASQNSFNLIQNGMGNLPSNDVHIDISQNRQS